MRLTYLTSCASLIALIFLCLLWEAVLAPIRPGGSWLMLKALPLLGPLFGVLRGRAYTYQWTSLLALAYLTEGLVRSWSDHGASAALAFAETVLAIALAASTALYARSAAAPAERMK